MIRTSLLTVCFALAVAAGYWVSSTLGAETLRIEAAKQLAQLMHGDVSIERARLVVRGGLFIEGERVGVYPTREAPHEPDLFAHHVSAELDVFALLAGRFRVSSLIIDDAHLRIWRRADGSWGPTPFAKLQARRKIRPPDDYEGRLDLFNAFEKSTRFLLSAPKIARRIELRRSRVSFVDGRVMDEEGSPLVLALQQVNGRLVHHWLTGEADLQLTAQLIDHNGRPIPIRADGSQRGGTNLELSLTTKNLDLSLPARYLGADSLERAPSGNVRGRLAFETDSEDHSTVSLRCTVDALSARLPLGSRDLLIERPLLEVDAALELHPGRVRLSRGLIEAHDVSVALQGTIDRPMRPAARLHLETSIGGLGLEDVRRIARSIPGNDGRTLDHLFERVESGRVDLVGGTGTARLSTWQELMAGELAELPPAFSTNARVSDVSVVTDEGRADLQQLSAQIELTGDRLQIRDTRATFDHAPLPLLDITIDGASRLWRGPPSARRLQARGSGLPGFDALRQWLLDVSEEATEPDPSRPPLRMQVKLDALDHAVLRWPIRDAVLDVTGIESGLRIEVEEALWAGAPAVGTIVITGEPEANVKVELAIGEPEQVDESEVTVEENGVEDATVAETPAAPAPGEVAAVQTQLEASPRAEWASGRFNMAMLDTPLVPLRDLSGHFVLTDDTLLLTRIRSEALPSGKLVASGTLDLSVHQEVPIDARLSIVGGDADHLARAMGFEPETMTGKVQVTGEITGALRPQTPLIESIDGLITMDARAGEIRREMPLLLKLIQASSGYNRMGEREAIVFDSATAQFELDNGRLSTEDFLVEGPVRLYATGVINVARPPHALDGVVGVFLFPGAGQIMETLPLFKVILPGSERGLVGAYYEVRGNLGEPTVAPMTGKSVTEDLPDLLAGPFNLLRTLFTGEATERDLLGSVDPDAEPGEDDATDPRPEPEPEPEQLQ